MIRFAAIVLAAFAAASAQAQSYPDHPVKMIVPFPAGGPTDAMARIVADGLAAKLGQAVIIDNRPGGAGGSVGAKAVATADPDGYTLLLTSPGPLTVAPVVQKNLGFDPLKDFVPVAFIMETPMVIVVNLKVPVKTFPEFIDYIRANPGKVSYGTQGFGTGTHLLGEMLKLEANVNLTLVPYRGSAPALADLLAGQVQMFTDTTNTLLPQIEAGTVRPLAVTVPERSKLLPNVPTTGEGGYPKLLATYWNAIVAPGGTPPELVKTLNAAVNAALQTADARERLAKLGVEAKLGPPEELTTAIVAELAQWQSVVKAAGIEPQ